VAAPALLALCRFGQGIGLGGEWGGAVLLATENAPAGREAWYGMFPQLGAPIGFILANGLFVLLGVLLSDAQFFAWGWRIPFLGSLLLVWVGLYVRLRLTETPAFQQALQREERVHVPLLTVLRSHGGVLVLATLAAVTTFVVFYLMTVFTLSYGTTVLGFVRQDFLILQIIAVLAFAVFIPVSALLADRIGRLRMLSFATLAIMLFGLAFGPLFTNAGALQVLLLLTLGLGCMGLTYGPLGTALAAAFPTAVRYTGASLAFNLAGILGGSLAPYIATWLAANHGIAAVGWYLSAAGLLTLLALLALARRGLR
jgi:MFS family permease